MISGYGPTAGAALCSHMDVDKVMCVGCLLVCCRKRLLGHSF